MVAPPPVGLRTMEGEAEVAVVDAAFTMPAVGIGGFAAALAAVAVVLFGVGVATGSGWDIGVS